MSRAPLLAQQAMRRAIDRALAADLTMREMKIFLSVVKTISFFDRTEDHIANRQIVDATGIDPRHVRRALQGLHDKGVIERKPGHGRTASLIKFTTGTSSSEGADAAPSEGARMAPAEGADSGVERGPIRHLGGGRGEPASEVLSEVLSEVCVSDLESLACSRLSTPTPAQHDEAKVKIRALAAIHGEDAVREALGKFPAKSVPFGGELARLLKSHLGDRPQAQVCERCQGTGQTSTGYPCGCPATPRYGGRRVVEV